MVLSQIVNLFIVQHCSGSRKRLKRNLNDPCKCVDPTSTRLFFLTSVIRKCERGFGMSSTGDYIDKEVFKKQELGNWKRATVSLSRRLVPSC